MLFSEVIGQEALKKQLVHLVEQKRLSHALLFAGPEGAGALPLAIAFAQYIVSLPANNEGAVADLFGAATTEVKADTFYTPDQIENLPAYHRASKLMHPDLHFSFPSIIEKSGEKNLSANYIEEWREFIMGYPYGNVFDWLQFIKAENKQGNISAAECAEVKKNYLLKVLKVLIKF